MGFAKKLLDGDAAFKLDAKDESGNLVGSTGDIFTIDQWKEHHHIEMVMPEGTAAVTAVIVVFADGVEVSYAFDDMFLMSMGILDVSHQ